MIPSMAGSRTYVGPAYYDSQQPVTIGVCCMFILNFAQRANALVNLTRKGVPFIFGQEQSAAQEDLKNALLSSPALRPIDYSSDAPVILAVDTSPIEVGFYLCQVDSNNPKK